MHVIFIVDAQGVAERVEHLEYRHDMFARDAGNAYRQLADKVLTLEAQASANELALRTLIDNPLNPVSAAAEARDILRILEG